MFLVVGLGNPGSQYDGTRHNVGFEVIDALAQTGATEGFRQSKRCLIAKAVLAGSPCLLVKPQLFMNLSGEAVGPLAHFYKVPPERILVVHDELDFAPGHVRLKPFGGHGGHNGLRDLLLHLPGDFPRVRLGIGKPRIRGKGKGADFVLARPQGAERVALDEGVTAAAEAVVLTLQLGLEAAMGRVNRGPILKASEP